MGFAEFFYLLWVFDLLKEKTIEYREKGLEQNREVGNRFALKEREKGLIV